MAFGRILATAGLASVAASVIPEKGKPTYGPSKPRVALVTGGGQGIGQAIILRFARDPVITGLACVDLVKERCWETVRLAEEVAAADGRQVTIGAFAADVGDYSSVENLANLVRAELGKVDILVNNAGITRDAMVSRMSHADWEAVIETNLSSMFYTSKQFVPDMIRAKWGRVINMSSVVGVKGNAGQTNYAASKAGVIGFSKALARETASKGVTVNAVAPGFVKSPMTDVLKEKVVEHVARTNPANRMARTEEIASVVVFLASEGASYVTGSILNVDAAQII